MIATFKRMKRFQPYEAIVAALKDSEFLDLTENEEVKRKVPLESNATGKTIHEAQQKWEDKSMDRSIYAVSWLFSCSSLLHLI
jgi:lupus La protein